MNTEQNFQNSTKASNDGNTVLVAVLLFEAIDELVRDYIYPKLYTLYNEKKLNKGNLPPHRQAKESVTIREFSSNGEKISVHIDIWWGGDCHDDEYVTLTCDEWDAVENCR